MLLPLFLYMLGWCYCLLLFIADVVPYDLLWYFELADVIAKWLMELPLSTDTWLMLLPGDWWSCHLWRYLADVIARWLMELPLQGGGAGRCHSQQADVICLVQSFNFSSEMLCRTSSQMCGRWYLPMFLLRDGSLTLIYRASLMVLMRFWLSLPTISKFSMLMLWPVML